jgi:RimJ/RimL family protein N-acetyltransferase
VFEFIRFQEFHLPLFRSWLNAGHIKPYWQETDDDQKLKQKFLVELPKQSVWPFVIAKSGKNIGYIQYYDAAKVGGGWWDNEPAGTFGIDLMIGDANLVGLGLGSKIIQEFIAFVHTKTAAVTSFIIDPSPDNKKAIRAFEKAGFVQEGEINTPGGPALLMRLKVIAIS